MSQPVIDGLVAEWTKAEKALEEAKKHIKTITDENVRLTVENARLAEEKERLEKELTKAYRKIAEYQEASKTPDQKFHDDLINEQSGAVS